MWIILLIALAILAADQVSKLLVCGFFLDPSTPLFSGLLEQVGDKRTLIPDWLSFTYVLNRGAAFGIMKNQRLFFLLVTLIVCVAGWILLMRQKKKHWLLKLSAGLVFGGALGNLVDRTLIGMVRDFISADVVETVTGWAFPVFNVADIAVVIGEILLAIYLLFLHDRVKKDDNGQSGE